MNDLSTTQLRRLLAIQSQIEKLTKEKQRILGGGEQTKTGRRVLSAATKKKLSQKLKAVWAERKRAKGG